MTSRSRGHARRLSVPALVASLTLTAVACASFPATAPDFSAQPSLTPNVVTVVPPSIPTDDSTSAPPQATSPSETAMSSGRPSPTSATPTGTPPTDSASTSPSSAGTPSKPSTEPADPCAPPALPVVAVCLTAPWGLAPLPDGQSALVGERTTGRILRVRAGRAPTPVATVPGIDSTSGGGLLGIALSSSYVEDNLIYAYVTTATDSRIVRIAPGDRPKPIFTGIKAGEASRGGPIAFGADGLLYVATGHSVLRLDTFGDPAAGNETGDAVFATGLRHPTGICPLPDGTMGVVDHRASEDVLMRLRNGADYRTVASGDAVWTFGAGDGGAVDCAIARGYLLATSIDARRVTALQLRDAGGFTGSPGHLLTGRYGRLRTITTGADGMAWLSTANGRGSAGADPRDDRVLVLPPDQVGGGSGGLD